MGDIFSILQEKLGIDGIILLKLVKTVSLLILLWAMRYIILKILWKGSEDVKVRYIWRKTLTYTTFFLSLLLVLMIWISGLKSLGTYLGLLSAGIAIALRDPITNLMGWIFIIFRKPFNVGDRVEINGLKGDIIDIRVSQFLMVEIGNWVEAEQSTGRIIHVPNNWVFQKSLANYTAGFEFIWDEIKLTITFESDWKKARHILEEIVTYTTQKINSSADKEIKKASRRFMIYYKHLTPIVYTKINDFGVVFTLRFLINPRHRRGIEQNIWQEILERFEKENQIDFAYPTQRFYNHQTEGKTGTQ